MRNKTTSELSIDELVSEYARLSEEHGEFSFTGKHKQANKCFDERDKVLSEILSRGSIAIEVLKGLINDNRAFVKIAAAGDLFAMYPEICEATLREASQLEHTPAGFTAKYLLKRLKSDTQSE